MSSHDEVIANLFLSTLPIKSDDFESLIRYYGTAEEAVKDGPGGWSKLEKCDASFVELIKTQWAKLYADAKSDFELANKTNTHIILRSDQLYPSQLKEIYNAPPIIYVQGEVDCLKEFSIAIVGSRACTYYGEKAAIELAAKLAEFGIITVSGLARGIDGHVHWSSLRSGGKTIAVLGSGLSYLYPQEHKALAEKIKENGALVSEFPLKTAPYPGNFPRRNRIIAGLGRATVVVEGSMKSGSLITAKLAGENGKDVMAVPGPIYSRNSDAPNFLIQSGAKLVRSVVDIIGEYKNEFEMKLEGTTFTAQKKINLDGDSKKILKYLSSMPVPKEIILKNMGGNVSSVSSLLLDLEMKGLIKSLPGNFIVKA